MMPVILVAGLSEAGKSTFIAHLRKHCGEHYGALVEVSPLTDLSERVSDGLNTVVTVVDASRLFDDFCSQQRVDALTEQIELADVVVLNKMDLLDAGRERSLIALVTALNPGATLLQCEHGRVVPSMVIGTRRAAPGWARALANETISDDDRLGISALVYRERRPFHPERLARLFDDAWPGVVRAKGIFWIATRPDWAAELSQAGASRRYRAVTSWWAATLEGRTFEPQELEELLGVAWDPVFGDRRQELAFVGIDFDAPALRSRLDACLLTDAELRSGPELWHSWSDPFPAWGLVVATRVH